MWLEYNGGRKQVHHVMDIIFVSSILMDAILRFVLGSNKSWVSKWIHGSYLRKNLAGNSKIMKLQDDLYIEYGLNGVWCITPPKKWIKSRVLHHPYDLCSWKISGYPPQEIVSLISRGSSPLLSFKEIGTPPRCLYISTRSVTFGTDVFKPEM